MSNEQPNLHRGFRWRMIPGVLLLMIGLPLFAVGAWSLFVVSKALLTHGMIVPLHNLAATLATLVVGVASVYYGSSLLR